MDGAVTRESIVLKAWIWQRVLGAAILWCKVCRRLHQGADNLCGWLARKCEGQIPEAAADPAHEMLP